MDLTDLLVKRTDMLSGTVTAPPSKAHSHRAIVASTLSEGFSMIRRPLICDDTLATINACSMLGAEISQLKDGLRVEGLSRPRTPENVIDCGESGSTMRFLTPICALADGISVLTGGESLRRRPMKPLLEALKYLGVNCYSSRPDGLPPIVVFGGGIKGGEAAIRGDVSSQYVSGLLFAAPMATNDTEINLTTQLESKPYVALTIDILRKHGVEVAFQADYRVFRIPHNQKYSPFDHSIEGDYSSGAFLLAAAAVTKSRIRIEELKKESLQGDRVIVDSLKEMGAQIEVGDDFVEIRGVDGDLKAMDIDLSDNPDLVPVCAAVACHIQGRSTIKGVKRLRFKESDRVLSLTSELQKMGAKIEALDNRLVIEGGSLHGAEVDSHGDHRIAMACAVTALRSDGLTEIRGVECINKSYPDFIRDLRSLGGDVLER